MTLLATMTARLAGARHLLRAATRPRLDHLRLRAALAVQRLRGRLAPGAGPRVLVTICWDFPVYSHSFVYQEITQLIAAGFQVQILYSRLADRANLGDSFQGLWRHVRQMPCDRGLAAADLAYFRKRAPARVEELLAEIAAATGIPVPALLDMDHVLYAFTFARAAEAFGADYVHSYFFYESSLFAAVAGALLGRPRGVSCYADHMLADYPLKMLPLHMAQTAVVVATSARIKEELCGFNPGARDRIVVKPNAVDVRDWQVPEDARTRSAPLTVVAVSRLDPKKGLEFLIRAGAVLRDAGTAVRIRILGAADDNAEAQAYAAMLHAEVARLGLHGVVEMPGAVSRTEVRAALFGADVLALPSVDLANGDKDGIPTALLEAMACALPVVVTDAGSITEVVTDGHSGLCVPQRDAAALASALARLAADPQLRRTLGAQARQVVVERFDVAVCEGVFHDAVRKAIAASGRAT